MREVLPTLMEAYERGEAVGVATVIRTWRSAPRPAGASMVVDLAGEAAGSVSGGCVEGAVYDVASAVRTDGIPQRVTYGISDDAAFEVGLTCGGILEVFVERVDALTWPELPSLARSIEAHEPVAVVTVVQDRNGRVGRHVVVRAEGIEGTLGSERLDAAVADDALGLLESGRTGFLRYGLDGERLEGELEVFVASYAPPPWLIVFGAIDFAAALATAGKFLGFRVTVCDARPVFATAKRFPDADEVIVDWPHRWLATQTTVDNRTVICVLTHDPKFDVPALEVALKTTAAYVGAMGSRRTHEDRLERLKDTSLTEVETKRLHSPIGLDIGARTPEETAVSILAEIVRERWGGSGRSLAESNGPIHVGVAR